MSREETIFKLTECANELFSYGDYDESLALLNCIERLCIYHCLDEPDEAIRLRKSMKVLNQKISLTVRETVKSTKHIKTKLTSKWCECQKDEFLCYPEDGACECGIHKHHVHCTCGGVSQIG